MKKLATIKKNLINWLSTEYSFNDATEQIVNASIEIKTVTLITITYRTGVKDIVYQNDLGEIVHINPRTK